MRRIRVVQASSPHTGSTVLANVLFGIFCGDKGRLQLGRLGAGAVFKTHRRPVGGGAGYVLGALS